ncbi:hypothetical protein J5N97_020600 [Dioscorea zingiberensis]|uniref:Pentatricopeptide repeat-containing protein n=1 Tax=Dioscorea zingiberensis TaxID=325984 RepID=A0A9D5CG55_9LILI|nr:hypothetical protein J5N97_020600 [Dioscorea zingiberensis]
MATIPPLSLLADCCSSMRELKQVHALMVVSGRILSDNYAASRILSFAALHPSGDFAHAFALFSHTPHPNSFMWNTIIRALADTPTPSSALGIYSQMHRLGVPPGKHTFPFVLKASANLRSLPTSTQIHSHVLKHGLHSDLYIVNGLMRSYTSCGLIAAARNLFDELPKRNVIVWTTMVCGYAQNSCSSEAISLFDEMMHAGVEPCDATLASVLSACARVKYGIEPKLEHYGCMVDLLGRSGRLAEAEELVKGMKWRADVVVLGALLTACKNHRNVEIAERVVKEILKLEPRNHGVYVVLSNIYAESRRWGDVLRLRRVMKQGGLKKIPGSSYVIDNGDNHCDRMLRCQSSD